MGLCEQCQAIFTGERRAYPRGEPRPESHHTKATWIAALSLGCSICRGLLQFTDGLPELVFPELNHDDEATERTMYDSAEENYMAEGCLEISFMPASLVGLHRGEYASRYRSSRLVYRKYRAVPVNMIDNLVAKHNPTGYTVSDFTVGLIKEWSRECMQSHEQCISQAAEAPFVPTRLLEVSPDALPEGEIRLVLTTSPEFMKKNNNKYLTLSHRWSEKVLKLTSTSLESFQESISLRSLSKTFRDAVDFTRRLGVDYIWIDSLCIMQDSTLDWLAESANMAEIYRNCWCNLSASGKYDGRYPDHVSDWGLYYERDPSSIFPEAIQSSWTNTDNERYYILDKGFWEFDWDDQPLSSRGWVVQERILAPRVIHFHPTQLVWQCREIDACEAFPTSLPPVNLLGVSLTRPSIREGSGIMKQWKHLVQTYSRRQLTFDSDKLIAFAGMAKEVARYRTDDYIAGLWRDDMISQILWNVYPPIRQANGLYSTRICHDSMPTWSWASIRGNLSFLEHDGQYQDVVEIVDAVSELASNNPYGHVKRTHLLISGRVYKWLPSRCELHIVQGIIGLGALMGRAVWPDVPVPEMEISKLGDETLEAAERRVLLRLLFLPVRMHISEDSNYKVVGLALEPILDRLGCYERYGVFTFHEQDTLEYFTDPQNALASGMYYENEAQHTISLV